MNSDVLTYLRNTAHTDMPVAARRHIFLTHAEHADYYGLHPQTRNNHVSGLILSTLHDLYAPNVDRDLFLEMFDELLGFVDAHRDSSDPEVRRECALQMDDVLGRMAPVRALGIAS